MADQYDYSKQPNNVIPEHANVPGVTDPDGSFITNLGDSASEFGRNLVTAAVHPYDTVKNGVNLAEGYLTKIGLGNKNGKVTAQQQQMMDAMNKHFGDRYGSLDKIKHTAYTDPVGFAADASTVLGPLSGGVGLVGDAADAAGMARAASTLSKVADVAKAGSELTNPLNVGKGASKALQTTGKVMSGAGMDAGSAVTRAGEAIEHPIQDLSTGLAKKWYRKALNPSGTVDEGTAKVNTLMNEGIGPANEPGAWDKITQYANQVKAMLRDPRAQGVSGDVTKVLGATDPLIAPTGPQSWEAQLAPGNGPDQVNQVRQDFVNKHFNPGTPAVPANLGQVVAGELTPNPTIVGATPAILATPPTPRPISLEDLQEEKQNTYRRLKDSDFGGGPSNAPIPAASRQANVALAKGARNEIGDKLSSVGLDGIHAINAKEGGLLDAMPDLQRNAAKLANSPGITESAREILIRHLLPQAAIGLYKAGRLPWNTTEYILKQGAAGSTVQEQANAQ